MINRRDFITKVTAPALRAQQATGIPAEYAIAQSAVESRWGDSELSIEANNYFGIKTEVRATVPRSEIQFDTREFQNGQWITVTALFAKYSSIDDCYLDWANYIVRRYPVAFAAAKAQDPHGFFKALQDGRYATDPRYFSTLIGTFEALYGLPPSGAVA